MPIPAPPRNCHICKHWQHWRDGVKRLETVQRPLRPLLVPVARRHRQRGHVLHAHELEQVVLHLQRERVLGGWELGKGSKF